MLQLEQAFLFLAKIYTKVIQFFEGIFGERFFLFSVYEITEVLQSFEMVSLFFG